MLSAACAHEIKKIKITTAIKMMKKIRTKTGIKITSKKKTCEPDRV